MPGVIDARKMPESGLHAFGMEKGGIADGCPAGNAARWRASVRRLAVPARAGRMGGTRVSG
jgi:hypothetical protein